MGLMGESVHDETLPFEASSAGAAVGMIGLESGNPLPPQTPEGPGARMESRGSVFLNPWIPETGSDRGGIPR